VDASKVPPLQAVARLAGLLDSPEIAALVSELEQTRWTGRPGYPIRCMVRMSLAKSLYCLPTWTRTVRLVGEHAGMQAALGCADGVPSEWACYRFTRKLREHPDALARCIDAVTAGLRNANPEMGRDIAVDASDMPAYANGQRHLYDGGPERERFSDPDATWGHRSAVSTRSHGGFYGFKLDMAVCSKTDLPLAWQVRTAKDNEASHALAMIDAAKARGFAAETAAMDRGYDFTAIYEGCAERAVLPVIPVRQTPAVKQGEHKPPTCEHGEWTFAGSDSKRGASKWRCPTGECQPKSAWIKADRLHPLIPRESKRFKSLYRRRSAVEREFGRLKHEWALAPLRVRGLDRVRLHADLTILAKLASALGAVRLHA
jgi:IS5 family transposase